MGVAETVKSLAEVVDRAKVPSNPRHRICIEILRLMPEYRDIRDLSAWESAYQGALEESDDESEVALLLWEVFEFGRLNMYGKFSPELTVGEFAALSDSFLKSGIKVPQPADLTDW